MSSHDSFEYLKHKLWPKEGPRVKLPIWLPTTKSEELPQFPYVKVTYHILLESLDEGYNFSLDFTSIGGLYTKLWASKVVRVPISGISRFPSGSPNLGVGPVARHKEYYKGEGGGFPQVWAMVSFVKLCLHVARPCTKSALTMH
jgi:hypothetical protein